VAVMGSYKAPQAPRPAWRRASFCQTGECVEVAAQGGMVVMRNSSHPGSGYLLYTTEEFSSFVRGVKAGEFDLLTS
jgi:hypothetical protein